MILKTSFNTIIYIYNTRPDNHIPILYSNSTPHRFRIQQGNPHFSTDFILNRVFWVGEGEQEVDQEGARECGVLEETREEEETMELIEKDFRCKMSMVKSRNFVRK